MIPARKSTKNPVRITVSILYFKDILCNLAVFFMVNALLLLRGQAGIKPRHRFLICETGRDSFMRLKKL